MRWLQALCESDTETESPTQAPIRKRVHAKARGKITPTRTGAYTSESTTVTASSHNDAPFDAAFASFARTKKDKERMRHSRLLGRIEKSAPGTASRKRRRPSKKLVAGLEGLLESLPDAESAGGHEEVWEGISDGEEDTDTVSDPSLERRARPRKRPVGTTISLKTLKSTRGAMKKKAKLQEAEKERFGKNMAQMADGIDNSAASHSDEQTASADGNAQRWAALRGFIGQSMQQNPAFMLG